MLLIDPARIVLVAGKGGTGKTTIAASLAVTASRAGKRTLLVSTDPAHSLADILATPLSGSPKTIEQGLDAMEIDADTLADDHVREVTRALKEFAHPDAWEEIDRQMTLSRRSPGTVEAALLEQFADLLPLAGERYDLLVFDTAPTGHTLRLLNLPGSLGDWTSRLLEQRETRSHAEKQPGGDFETAERNRRIARRLKNRQQKFELARDLLTDAACTRVLVVTLPERLPILESERLIETLRETGIALAGLVVNGLLPEEDESEFLRQRRRRQSRQLERIAAQFQSIPRTTLPLSTDDPVGTSALAGIGDRLWSR